MPPCHSVLTNKVKRANYIASVWKHANQAEPCAWDPLQHGWVLEPDDGFQINWFNGDQVPKDIVNILDGGSATDDDNDSDHAYGTDESDTESEDD